MLRVTPSRSAEGAKQYFGKGLTSDYYIDGQEIVGRWGGKAAERLGLSGDVDAESYFALCDNRHPATGERLTPRQKDNRRVGYDFTVSAPKSVSVLYELSGDERILDAFRESVNETMQDIEREMKTRVRAKGANEDRVTGNMAWAEFVHFTSRPVDGLPDPHLHAHVYAFNMTWDGQESRWKAGQFGDLKRDAPYWEAAFDARLAHRLNALGYRTAKDPKYSFEVAGVPESVINKFSARRNAIEAAAAKKGIVTPEGKHAIGYWGRENKTLEQGKAELRAAWDAKLTPEDRQALKALMDGNGSHTGDRMTPQKALQFAIDHSFERVSAMSEKRLKAEALKHGVGSVLPGDIDDLMAKDVSLIRQSANGEAMVTTSAVYEGELRMLAFARDGIGKYRPFGSPELLPEGLSAEQGAAAAHVLQSRDRVTAIRGAAGTGKTYLMKSTIAAIEQSKAGRKVHVFAPSAQASRGVLRGEGFANAETLERLLVDEQLQRQVKGQVLWVDEAGMIGNRDMQRLFDVASRQDCRIILSGDYRQHGSIKAGDSFRLLESQAGVRFAEIKTIRRQEHPGYRKVVEMISKGDPVNVRKGFDRLNQMGAVVEASGAERHGMLVKDYLQAVNDGRSALIIAPTHAEGDALTDTLRLALKERGTLGAEQTFKVRRSTNWTDAQKCDVRNYQEGMLVEFHQNTGGGFKRGECAAVLGAKDGRVSLLRQSGERATLPADAPARFQVYTVHDLAVAQGERLRILKNGKTRDGKRINNGDIVSVKGFTDNGDLELSDGKVLAKTYGHFGPGYVDTSFASQGKNVHRVFIAAGDASIPAVNAQQWYVSVSRGRESCKVYVDDKREVRDAIAHSGQRMAAVELVGQQRNARVKETQERNRVAQAVKDRAQSLVPSRRHREPDRHA